MNCGNTFLVVENVWNLLGKSSSRLGIFGITTLFKTKTSGSWIPEVCKPDFLNVQ